LFELQQMREGCVLAISPTKKRKLDEIMDGKGSGVTQIGFDNEPKPTKRKFELKSNASTPKPPVKKRKGDKKVKQLAKGTPISKQKEIREKTDGIDYKALLEKERKKWQKEKETLQTEVNDLQYQVKEYECINKTLKAERERAMTRIQVLTTKLDSSRSELIKFIRKLTECERREKASRLEKDNKLIGRVELIQDPLNAKQHAFRNGIIFKECERKQKEYDAEKKSVEQRKKELRTEMRNSRKSKQQAEASSTDGTDSPFRKPHRPQVDEFAVRNEVLKMQSDQLKSRQNMLNEKKEDLKRKKILHIKFIANMEAESRSVWKDMRVVGNQGNQRYLLTHLLGKGGFSEVWKAYDLAKFRWVACKIHQLSDAWDNHRKSNYTRHAKREYEIHKSLSHPRVVPFYDIIGVNNGTFCTILQFCEGTDLDMHLKMRHHLKESEARCLIAQVLEGLQYLNQQSQPIIHYDLKPANLLINNCEAKITDFGLSKRNDSPTTSEIDLTTPGAGTYWYLAPECFVGAKISNKVDMWAVGIIFYQMLVGERPLGHKLSQKEILEHGSILRGEITFPSSPKISDEAKKFIRDCLSHNPRDRPNPLDCLQTHPYFAKIRK